MKRVLKFTLRNTRLVEIDIPGKLIKPLFVAEQHGELTLWAEVETPDRPYIVPRNQVSVRSNPYEGERVFIWVFPTGEPIPVDLTYIGTGYCKGGNLIWHIYYRP